MSNGFLASVRSVAEALLAESGGANIIDFKEPASGALGALPSDIIETAMLALGGRVATSATIGDVPLVPGLVFEAVRRAAETGVDYVKLGLFEGDMPATLAALGPAVRRHSLIAVVFADRSPDFSVIEQIADAGFAGIMLDTAGKDGGSLTAHLSVAALGQFVERGHARSLLVGLAGSLRREDIGALAPLGADYLGFRSALTSGVRSGPLSAEGVATIRQALDASRTATAAAGAASATVSASAAEA